jgi:hypothetical protein
MKFQALLGPGRMGCESATGVGAVDDASGSPVVLATVLLAAEETRLPVPKEEPPWMRTGGAAAPCVLNDIQALHGGGTEGHTRWSS